MAEDRRRHLTIPPHRTDVRDYVYPRPPPIKVRSVVPRNASAHGDILGRQLRRVADALPDLVQERAALGLALGDGVVLEFASEPGFPLALASLNRPSSGIELLSVRDRGASTMATVFVPDGQLGVLERLIDDYRTKVRRSGRPYNEPLVANISEIRQAALESLWTDDGDPPVDPTWWEVWLRAPEDVEWVFRACCQQLGLRVSVRSQLLLDRRVVLAHGSRGQLASSVRLLDSIAELRRPGEAASFFTDLTAWEEEAAWIDSLLNECPPSATHESPAVCLLDTGVNRGHSLLAPLLSEADQHTVDMDWGVSDHDGHGTEMAGLVAWGELSVALAGDGVSPWHLLESVVLLPPEGAAATQPELYGAVTAAAVSLPEIQAPVRPRVFCLTILSREGRDLGRPSAWSAEVDLLAEGSRDGQRRLVVIAAGNVREREEWLDWPARNDLEGIHDPAQAWNALTVGAFTAKAEIQDHAWEAWRPIAALGTLAPASSTSVPWLRGWPIKPDVVMEGGNGATNGTDVAVPASLRLLTTSSQPGLRQFTTTGDTSAAAALGARLCARLTCAYLEFWPETIRALVVHSARWTPEMVDHLPRSATREAAHRLLLERYGWGVADFGRAAFSGSDALTLVAQRTIVPFEDFAQPGRAPDVRTKDWHLFDLPWPRRVLEDLGGLAVRLRVTLSYFVEPSAGRRGETRRHRYRSVGLRFALQNPLESEAVFRARVSKAEQDAERGRPGFSEPGWALSDRLRNRGSIHSDWWDGTAVELAARDRLAVFPVDGWWRHRRTFARWGREVRYALVVSIEAPEAAVDLYNLVETLIEQPVEVTT